MFLDTDTVNIDTNQEASTDASKEVSQETLPETVSTPAQSVASPSAPSSDYSSRPYFKPGLKGKKKNKKICILCKRGVLLVNYKDTELLGNYIKKYNKILTHKISGNCIKHQHQLSNAIKRARYIGLLPFVCD